MKYTAVASINFKQLPASKENKKIAVLHRPAWEEHLFEPATRYYTQMQLLDI